MAAGIRNPVLVASLLALASISAAPSRAEEPKAQNPYASVKWTMGPGVGRLGKVGEIKVPEGYAFVGGRDAIKFIELTHNISAGNELGILVPTAEDQKWWIVFEFDAIGHVKDDDQSKLDADAILASVREGTEAGNKERKRRGWPAMVVVGWHVPPAYDAGTHHLEWAIEGRSEDSESSSINHSTRLLGREGVLKAALVCGPEEFATALEQTHTLLGGFEFNPGKRYAEFRQGDKIAAVGLTGLIVGGAAVAAAKSGLLAKLLKPLIVGLFVMFAAIRRWFMNLLGRLFRARQPQ